MNRPPDADDDERGGGGPSLADILSDPAAQWKDIREAMKAQGRGSFFAGGNGRALGATTNASLVRALRESRASGASKAATLAEATRGAAPPGTRGGATAPAEAEACGPSVEWGGEEEAEDAAATGGGKDGSAANHDSYGSEGSGGAKVAFSPTGEKAEKGTSLDGLDDSACSVDSSKSGSKPAGDMRRAPPLPRRKPRSSSDRGASFKSSINRGTTLKNVIFEDAEADMDELNEESDSQSSGGGILPPCRMPLYKAGSYRKGKAGGPVPVRRLTKGGSSKATGSSFKGSLRNVAEDKEVDADDEEEADGAEGSGPAEDPPLERRRTLPARRARTGPAHDSANSDSNSIRLFHSDTTASSRRVKESVNIMDFGVDHGGRPFTESMLSLNISERSPAGNNESLSNFVDSQGFLGWNHDDSSESTSLSGNFTGYRPVRKGQSDRRTSMDSSASSLTNLDSVGFLGWESQRQLVDSSKDLATAASGDDGDGEDDAGEEKRPASKEEFDDFNASEKTWRIEDYENPNDNVVDPLARAGSGNGLTKQIRRRSGRLIEGLAAKMNTWNVGDDDDDDIPAEIQTDDIKNILLKSRAKSESESALSSMGNKGKEEDRRGWALFRRSNPDTSAEPDDYYSRPAIRINREDDVDIGEMRRALHRESLPKGNKNKLNMGFF